MAKTRDLIERGLGVFTIPAVGGFALFALLFVLSGCECVSTETARAYERAVSPEYLEYVEADPNLSEAQKEDRRTNTERFRVLLGEVEGGGA